MSYHLSFQKTWGCLTFFFVYIFTSFSRQRIVKYMFLYLVEYIVTFEYRSHVEDLSEYGFSNQNSKKVVLPSFSYKISQASVCKTVFISFHFSNAGVIWTHKRFKGTDKIMNLAYNKIDCIPINCKEQVYHQ